MAERQILDARLHMPAAREASSPYASWNLSETAFVRALDKYGIGRAVLHPLPVQDADFAACVRRNREVLRLIERYPRRFTGACCVDLRYPDESSREIETWKKQFGMVWVADFGLPAKGAPEIDRILQQIQSLNMIATVSSDASGAGAVARAHPSAALVFCHLEFGMDPYVPRFEAIRGSSGFHTDTSPRGYERMGLIEMAVERLGGSKILFASRFSMHSAAAVIARVENAFLDEKQKEAIFAGNAESLLAKAGWKF